MSKIAKLRERMQNNPRDWRIEDVEVLARSHGFDCLEGKGSHKKIMHQKLPDILIVPAARPIKPIYIKKLLALIDKLEEI